ADLRLADLAAYSAKTGLPQDVPGAGLARGKHPFGADEGWALRAKIQVRVVVGRPGRWRKRIRELRRGRVDRENRVAEVVRVTDTGFAVTDSHEQPARSIYYRPRRCLNASLPSGRHRVCDRCPVSDRYAHHPTEVVPAIAEPPAERHPDPVRAQRQRAPLLPRVRSRARQGDARPPAHGSGAQVQRDKLVTHGPAVLGDGEYRA